MPLIHKKTKQIVLLSLFTAIVCIISPFVIPIGSVPFSLAIFAIALVGAMLPPIQAVVCVSCYILIGLLGFPVFAGFKAGFPVLFSATGGFLLGYYFVAFFISLAKNKKIVTQLLYGVLGLVMCHALGLIWFMFIFGVGIWQAFLISSAPFIIIDIIKIILALLLAKQLKKRLAKTNLYS